MFTHTYIRLGLAGYQPWADYWPSINTSVHQRLIKHNRVKAGGGGKGTRQRTRRVLSFDNAFHSSWLLSDWKLCFILLFMQWLKWHNRLCVVLHAVPHTSRFVSRNNLINKTSKSRSDYSQHMIKLREFLSPPPHASPSSLLVCALFLYHPPPPSWLSALHLAPGAEVSVSLLPWWVCGPAFPPPHSVRLRPHASIKNIHSVDWLGPVCPGYAWL